MEFNFGQFVRLGFQANPQLLKDQLSDYQMTLLYSIPPPQKISGLTANACQCLINMAKKAGNTDMIKRMRIVRNLLLKEIKGSHIMTCVVCEKNQGVVFFTPCQHMCVCVYCHMDLRFRKCPICKEDIHYVVKDNHIQSKCREN